MHIIIVTDGSRPKQFEQTCRTLQDNSVNKHLVHVEYDVEPRRGIGGCRNDAVATLGKPDDGLLMFLDSDFYMLPRWDINLISTYNAFQFHQLGGWSHPFNRPIKFLHRGPNFVFTVCAVAGGCCVMSWDTWKRFGPWKSGAVGPGMSEDWEYSQRIRNEGLEVACRWPYIGIHTGVVNSKGEKVVGYEYLIQEVEEQIAANGIKDIVLEG